MIKVNEFVKKYLMTIVGIVLGAIGGYLFWRFIGCSSGNCLITSSPIMSTLVGSLIGGMLLNMFKKEE